MWLRTVVLVTCAVSCVVSVANLQNDDDISSEDLLQDITARTKKSPAVIAAEDLGSSSALRGTYSESSSEVKTLLAEDIKHKIEDIKQLSEAYSKVESDFFGIKKENDSSSEKNKLVTLKSEDTTSFDDSTDETTEDDDSVRIARQYYFNPQPNGGEVMLTQSAFPSYRVSQSPTDMTTYSGDPYIAQVDPSARTYGAAGIQAGVETSAYGGVEAGGVHGGQGNFQTVVHTAPPKPLKQLKQLIPNVISAISDLVPPAKPVTTVSSGGYGHSHGHIKGHTHSVAIPVTITHEKPIVHTFKPEVYVKPAEVIVKPHVAVVDPHHPKKDLLKGLTIPPVFFSKQIIFGIGADTKPSHISPHQETVIHEGHYYTPHPHSYFPPPQLYSYYDPLHNYYSPGHSLFAQSYPWYPDRSSYYPGGPVYPAFPDVQANYDPNIAYPQGEAVFAPQSLDEKAFYPINNNVRSSLYQYQPYSETNTNNEPSQPISESTLGSSKPATLEELEIKINEEQQKLYALQKKIKSSAKPFLDKKEMLLTETDEIQENWKNLEKDLKKAKDILEVDAQLNLKKDQQDELKSN